MARVSSRQNVAPPLVALFVLSSAETLRQYFVPNGESYPSLKKRGRGDFGQVCSLFSDEFGFSVIAVGGESVISDAARVTTCQAA